ncbi:cysteine--tRNA ligase [Candidatus Woesearchaeota archaeon]|nr:cysteine--tRNA ligase [Candidatus Woesearchaeota archaeon]
MAFKIFNTLTREKDMFKPIVQGKVGMYTCGPTVYNFAHIGNFRAYVCSDLLRRYLEHSGHDVRHIMNLTDVDDKTIRDSQKEGVSLKEFTERYSRAFFEDIDMLNIERAHAFPKATEHIPEMVNAVKKLMADGVAYKGEDGSIYYSVAKFPDYGKLSKIRADELQAGARVKQDEYTKESARDFALWKSYDPSDGDVYWETELGKGRPGWHIECSVMSTKYLGNHFDIHCGGIDLVFPHHENEIAQAEAYSGEKFVNYWVHNEWILVDGKKMSKSLGNFYTLRDLLQKGYPAMAIRYLLLSTHYRVQLNFTLDGIEAAKSTVNRLNEFIRNLKDVKEGEENPEISKDIEAARTGFNEKMDDDLNISEGLAVLFEFVRKINISIQEKRISHEDAASVIKFMQQTDKVLGVMTFEDEEMPPDLAEMIEKRKAARAAKDWAEADRIRDMIKEKGYIVEDSKDGFRWKRA